ncbi:MAG: hypothetical protein IJH20_05830 [Bacilli bacterium]|nr:hypothetical protein [Bacilli bacterium]
MKILDYINENKDKKIDIYFDMDGVICEYDIGNFDYNTIRPINNTINLMKKLIDDGINVYILSICKTNKIVDEKYEYLDKHIPFFDKDKAIFLSKEEINSESKDMKSDYLTNNINKKNVNILVDDDITIIKKITSDNKDVKVFHISSIIE